MNLLKILHTESSRGWGGQELRILTESKALVERGHRISIAAPPDAPIFHKAKDLRLEVIDLPIQEKSIRGLIAIRALIKSRDFDVINTHSSTDSWLVALACKTMFEAPRIVRTRHISTPVRPTAANRWLFGKAAARVVTTGEALRDMLVRDLALDSAYVTSVPTGVDCNLYIPVTDDEKRALRIALGVPADKVIVGTVCTLRLLKGLEYLFEAIRLLEDETFLLYVVGDGPQRRRLEDWILRNSMQDMIKIVGGQNNVHEWLQCFDIFAFPSLAEGVPQALIQAMLTELPCVTTNVGGIPEFAVNQQTAILIPPRRPELLSSAIRSLSNDPILSKSLGYAARGRCKVHNSIQKMADQMEFVLTSAAKNL
jgi:glycosyltransferase involved in cell wall biosynthesis